MFKKISKLCCVQTRVHPILMMHLSKCSVMFRVCVKETNSQSEVDDFPQEPQTEGVYELNLRCFAAIAGNLLMTGVAAVPGNFPRKAARSARGRSCGSSPKLDRAELMFYSAQPSLTSARHAAPPPLQLSIFTRQMSP